MVAVRARSVPMGAGASASGAETGFDAVVMHDDGSRCRFAGAASEPKPRPAAQRGPRPPSTPPPSTWQTAPGTVFAAGSADDKENVGVPVEDRSRSRAAAALSISTPQKPQVRSDMGASPVFESPGESALRDDASPGKSATREERTRVAFGTWSEADASRLDADSNVAPESLARVFGLAPAPPSLANRKCELDAGPRERRRLFDDLPCCGGRGCPHCCSLAAVGFR